MPEKHNFSRKTDQNSPIGLSYPADLAGPLRITFGSSSIILCFSLLPLGHYYIKFLAIDTFFKIQMTKRFKLINGIISINNFLYIIALK